MRHTKQTSSVRQLEPGDRVLFYSDGIIEARNVQGQEFGLTRFVDFIIRRAADAPAATRRHRPSAAKAQRRKIRGPPPADAPNLTRC
ncbi:SpoIIE family protein phosphatase [Streptosporangium canum]|uniref:SpoIIE family protein phosphatase n=1 Tax=Streptosporangium canum TaxID=324952 RepID=UPI003F4D76A1